MGLDDGLCRDDNEYIAQYQCLVHNIKLNQINLRIQPILDPATERDTERIRQKECNGVHQTLGAKNSSARDHEYERDAPIDPSTPHSHSSRKGCTVALFQRTVRVVAWISMDISVTAKNKGSSSAQKYILGQRDIKSSVMCHARNGSEGGRVGKPVPDHGVPHDKRLKATSNGDKK